MSEHEKRRHAGNQPAKPVALREVSQGDLPIFFEQQLDPLANHMAAFTSEDPADRKAFMARWSRIMGERSIFRRTILFEDQVVGHLVSFERFGNREVAYWLGREYWGRGLATAALRAFLSVVDERPLYARAAADNLASRRVLEKCGFVVVERDKAYAHARGEETAEVVMMLR